MTNSPSVKPQQSDADAERRLRDILEHLYSFYHTEIELSLDRVRRFLTQLGDPHLNLPPVVHIAGTNGKGSVTATLRALLEAGGKKVHVMTSPHLVHPTERIRLAGELISTQGLIDVLEECLAVNRDGPITFFEMFTAATFLAFSRMPADYALLETGMGGRLDATNVVPQPACTIITAIGMDHEKFLGNTLQQIAKEKAGIMKPGVSCVIGKQSLEAEQAEVMEVFRDSSAGLSPEAPLLSYGTEWISEPFEGQMRFVYESDSCLLPRPNLLGTHQIHNAGAALAAYRVIEKHLPDADILSTAMGGIEWPGRLQTLETGPLPESLPTGWHLVLDGGHNSSAGEILAEQAEKWRKENAKPLHLVIAMVNRKNPADFLKPLIPYTDSITVTEIPGEASSFSAAELREKIAPLGFKEVNEAETVQAALRHIADKYGQAPGRVLITGSLYLLGSILK